MEDHFRYKKYFKFSLRDAWILKMQMNKCQNSMGGLPPTCQTLVYDNGKQIVLCIKQTELSIIQTWHLVYFLKLSYLSVSIFIILKMKKKPVHYANIQNIILYRTSFDVLRWLAINTSIIVIFYTCNCSVAKLDMRKNAEHKIWNCWE